MISGIVCVAHLAVAVASDRIDRSQNANTVSATASQSAAKSNAKANSKSRKSARKIQTASNNAESAPTASSSAAATTEQSSSAVATSPEKPAVKPGATANSIAHRVSFQQLDNEAEQLLKEVLDLSSDLAIVDEQQNNPAKFQLLVLVTMAPTELFKLDYLELKIDDQTVAAHNYTSSEHDALQLGGGQRLYVANLPAGMHKLYAAMAGRVPRDPDYKSVVNYSFISGVSRTVLELSVSGAQTRGFPTLQVVEHN